MPVCLVVTKASNRCGRTSSGMLFETDLQLRPSGASGLLVSSIEAFERYQEESAWVWEHQALTRARYCAGDRNVGDSFERIRKKILERERETAVLAREVLAMREKLHAAHPNKSGLFDLKHDRGGMIDIEFTVQFLVLAHAHRHGELTQNLGNIALLGMAARLGLIPQDLADYLDEAAACQDTLNGVFEGGPNMFQDVIASVASALAARKKSRLR